MRNVLSIRPLFNDEPNVFKPQPLEIHLESAAERFFQILYLVLYLFRCHILYCWLFQSLGRAFPLKKKTPHFFSCCRWPKLSSNPIRHNSWNFYNYGFVTRIGSENVWRLNYFILQSASESRRRFFLTSFPELSRRGLPAADAPSVPCRNSAAARVRLGGSIPFPQRRQIAFTPSICSKGFFSRTFTLVTSCGKRVQHFASFDSG